MKIGIFYYSRTGITKKIAEEIHSETDSDLFRIDDGKKNRSFLLSIFETIFKIKPKIKPIDVDFRDYNMVVIGTPVWGNSMASPVRTFISKYGGKIKNTAFFYTMDGQGDHSTFNEMKSMLKKDPLAIVSLTKREIRSETRHLKLKTFCEGLNVTSNYR